MNFEHSMYYVNAAFGPSWNGVQFGNHKAELQLAKITTKILEKEIKRRSKDD